MGRPTSDVVDDPTAEDERRRHPDRRPRSEEHDQVRATLRADLPKHRSSRHDAAIAARTSSTHRPLESRQVHAMVSTFVVVARRLPS